MSQSSAGHEKSLFTAVGFICTHSLQHCQVGFSFTLSYEFVDKPQSVTIQMRATEQYFPVVLFIVLYKVVLTFESLYEILKCDHSNESY